MRRTPVSERPDDFMDDERPESASIRRISTAPDGQHTTGRGDGRYRRSGIWSQPRPIRRGPGALGWLLRAVLGLCTLAAIWLALQWLFPVAEPRMAESPPAVETPIPSQVGAPEPPPVVPTQAAPSQPAPTLVAQPTAVAQADHLPGLATPVSANAAAPEQSAAPAESTEQSSASEEQAQPGSPAAAPVPPPGGAPASASAPRSQAPPPVPAPTRAPPPAPGGTNGPLQLRATASPANPVSANAVVTIGVNLTANGAPVSGAHCMATVYFRTATVRQPAGGVTTGPGGAASFQVDAKGATFDRHVPVDVTCSSRLGTVTARTGFTPVRGR